MKKNWKTLAVCILIPLVTGAVAGFLTRGGMESFDALYQPPLSPPAWLFPVVWTILYLLMGISSYLIYKNGLQSNGGKVAKKASVEKGKVTQALTIYGYQLLVNFLWPFFFFCFQWYFFSFLWLALLWVLAARMILQFGEISRLAALLNVPYLLWLSFAGYLNLGIWLLN